MILDQKFIEMAIPGVTFQGAQFCAGENWVIDSRVVKPGDIFIALKGKHVDGHMFIEEAFARGASACMVTRHILPYDGPVNKALILVDDTELALYQLASLWREQFTYPVIGITGSVGKTTTKEIIARIMRLHGVSCIVSEGNLNTRIGLALSILRMKSEHEMAIFEMGISCRGEMEHLAYMARPTIAIITSIGHSHMEGLGSLADIAAEKRTIFNYLKPDGIGIINGDQPLLGGVAYTHPMIKFGCKMINQIQARQIQSQPDGIQFILKVYREKVRVRIPSENQARIYNALAAAAVAYYFHIPLMTIVHGIEEKIDVPGRFHKKKIGYSQRTIIDDCYNANPESMKSALLAFEKIKGTGHKIAVLGDMLELGMNAPFWHRQLGRFLKKVPSLNHLILVGEQVRWASKTLPLGLSYDLVPNWQAAVTKVQDCLTEGNEACILVKASRGMELNKLIDKLAHTS